MSLRDKLPPELRKLADGPVVDPPDSPSEHAQERSSRQESAQTGESEGAARESAPEQSALFAAPVDPHTGTTRITMLADERVPPDRAAFVNIEQSSPLELAQTTPVARNTDPVTSHQAAESVGPLRPRQQAVLSMLTDVGAMTDEEIFDAYAAHPGLPRQSLSGLRTRRSELVAVGLVRDSGGRRKLRSGRNGIVWEVAS